MSALNELANIKKAKLKDFQGEINKRRRGLLTDSTIEAWKGLTKDERKLKITVFLCMAMFSEDELKLINEEINPRSEPFINGFKFLVGVLAIIPIYKTITYLAAERVYPKALEYEVVFQDGSVDTYRLLDEPTMIQQDTESGTVLMDTGFFDWILFKSKEARYDSTVWTVDKDLSDNLIYFYSEFQGNAPLQKEFIKVPLSIEQIYEAAIYDGPTDIGGIKLIRGPKLRMDLAVPPNLASTYSPFYSYTIEGEATYFFLSITDGEKFWNKKIDFRNNKILREEQIVFFIDGTFQPMNDRKIIWENTGQFEIPALKIFSPKNFKEGASKDYFISDLEKSIAKQL
jgi:hypothetical protein